MGKPKIPVSHLLLAQHLKELGLAYTTEVRFDDRRLWRWDFALPDHRIAIEIDGGIWLGKHGAHSSGMGIQRQMDKRNHGNMLGWRVLVFSSSDILKGRARAFLKHYLDNAGAGA